MSTQCAGVSFLSRLHKVDLYKNVQLAQNLLPLSRHKGIVNSMGNQILYVTPIRKRVETIEESVDMSQATTTYLKKKIARTLYCSGSILRYICGILPVKG